MVRNFRNLFSFFCGLNEMEFIFVKITELIYVWPFYMKNDHYLKYFSQYVHIFFKHLHVALYTHRHTHTQG